jgi:hypothetical protein
MGWLENAFGIEPEPVAAPATRQAPEIKSMYVAVRHQSDAPGDLGETVVAHYIVDDGVLTMCSEDGKPLDGQSHTLAPGENPRAVASRLRRQAWLRESGSDFNRPIHYGSAFGVV